ncbi:serine/threonine protein kinase [Gloeomargarita lithophora Alchichica-D10]|uniref:Serine/threonine protein kinase n=1 Tax=Gloeomargarita lithophora Alchichica-D10 TaxID=1188229 RepID=A0A1J0AH09_9CYAN|nr:response regulator [Gloeomargarita lithophora]APB35184.1 serine/threonine protein kinase [Gloeomargarita lithophora Alchichica-D10]
MHTLLIVEDNELNRDMLLRRLQRKGFQVVTATDGQMGVDMAQQHLPHLILMDLSLPGLDGWEATRILKDNATTRHIPVIALTAHAMGGDREKALAAGCDDYDTKPVELERLLGKIHALLGKEPLLPPESQPASPAPPKASLLIVDDNADNRDMLSRRLLRQGYGVEAVESGEAALERIAQAKFDLVLLDVMMPGMGGLATLERLRQTYSQAQLPVIMATARSQSEDMVEAFRLGANDYITKPIDFAVALARIEAQLATVAATQTPVEWSDPNLLAHRYRMVRLLGQGGFGMTYLAQDTHRPGEPLCVVKQLRPTPPHAEISATARRLFNTEAETLEKLGAHDQIPRLLAYFEQEEQFYLVQEYIEGESLSQELHPGQPLPEPQVLNLVISILKILEFVHANRVIHRDVKPDNIIRRTSDCKLVLIDFGIVKCLEASLTPEHITRNQTVSVGTMGYAPIEQCMGQPVFSSDIYAVGMIALQALTGQTLEQIELHPERGELDWRLLLTGGAVSVATANVLEKMVRQHCKERYACVADVLRDIAQVPIVRQWLEQRRTKGLPS